MRYVLTKDAVYSDRTFYAGAVFTSCEPTHSSRLERQIVSAMIGSGRVVCGRFGRGQWRLIPTTDCKVL